MQVNYSADVSALDQPVIEASRERPGKAIRIRIPLLLYRERPDGTASSGVYRSWNNVSWIIECESAEEAVRTRETMQAFFSAIATYGVAGVHDALTQWLTTKPTAT